MAKLGGGSAPTGTWEYDVLRGIGADGTDDNLHALSLWALAEGAPDYAHNWLNTTEPAPGATCRVRLSATSCVWNYPTLAVGVGATVATLQQQNMAAIRRALVAGANLMTIWQAIHDSAWGGAGAPADYPGPLYGYARRLGITHPSPFVAHPGPPLKGGASEIDWHDKIRATAAAHQAGARYLAGAAKALAGLTRGR